MDLCATISDSMRLAMLWLARLTDITSSITPTTKARKMAARLRIKMGRRRVCGVEKWNSEITRGKRKIKNVCESMREFS